LCGEKKGTGLWFQSTHGLSCPGWYTGKFPAVWIQSWKGEGSTVVEQVESRGLTTRFSVVNINAGPSQGARVSEDGGRKDG